MSLSAVEQIVLWGPAVTLLLISIGYYLRWGKESDEQTSGSSRSSVGGDQ